MPVASSALRLASLHAPWDCTEGLSREPLRDATCFSVRFSLVQPIQPLVEGIPVGGHEVAHRMAGVFEDDDGQIRVFAFGYVLTQKFGASVRREMHIVYAEEGEHWAGDLREVFCRARQQGSFHRVADQSRLLRRETP